MRGIALIGASTGAPRTHHLYLRAMPPELAVPVIIVQHMPPGPFMDGMLRYLQRAVELPVRLAKENELLRPREVLLARPGTQARIVPGGLLRSTAHRGENYFSPSMDVTFESAARVFGPRCCVAMLSGLHATHDGIRGCQAVRAAGGRVFVSDAASTPCGAMIAQVRKAGAIDEEVPIDGLLVAMMRWLQG